MQYIRKTGILSGCVCLIAFCLLYQADGAQLGDMKADKILFLGNSITACEQTQTGAMWGLTASEPAKDYAHLLTGKINAATGGSMELIPTTMPYTNPDGSIAQNGSNVVNIADVFERSYAAYSASKFATQLAWQADIVVLQFGENIPNTPQNPFDPATFTVSLRSLLGDLKQSSDPHIFVTSYVMGEPAGLADIKRQLCAEDPAHRTFVDLTAVMQTPANVGGYNHPSDAGMAVIADTIYGAMVAHSTPEPGTAPLLGMGVLTALVYWWRKRNNA